LVDVAPLNADLDEELGVFTEEAVADAEP
jgi:hypothetical protein